MRRAIHPLRFRHVHGVVLSFSNFNCYGFIDTEHGNVFVHRNNILIDPPTLRPNQHVTFDIYDGSRGLQAANVVLTDPSSDDTAPQLSRPTTRRAGVRRASSEASKRSEEKDETKEDDASGIDPDRCEDHVHEELVCSICHGVLNSPVQTPCEHLFCRYCISKWLKEEQFCPNDRKPVTQRDLREAPCYLRSLLAHMRVRCRYTDLGCRSVVRVEQLATHERDCPNKNGESDAAQQIASTVPDTVKAAPAHSTVSGRQSVSTSTVNSQSRSTSTSTPQSKSRSTLTTTLQKRTVSTSTSTPKSKEKSVMTSISQSRMVSTATQTTSTSAIKSRSRSRSQTRSVSRERSALSTPAPQGGSGTSTSTSAPQGGPAPSSSMSTPTAEASISASTIQEKSTPSTSASTSASQVKSTPSTSASTSTSHERSTPSASTSGATHSSSFTSKSASSSAPSQSKSSNESTSAASNGHHRHSASKSKTKSSKSRRRNSRSQARKTTTPSTETFSTTENFSTDGLPSVPLTPANCLFCDLRYAHFFENWTSTLDFSRSGSPPLLEYHLCVEDRCIVCNSGSVSQILDKSFLLRNKEWVRFEEICLRDSCAYVSAVIVYSILHFVLLWKYVV